jgi:DNA invertase Pin-like site-specific DNA recombinase
MEAHHVNDSAGQGRAICADVHREAGLFDRASDGGHRGIRPLAWFSYCADYADDGRSGLRLDGRPGLQELLRDVLSGEPGFQALLIFDVSRWGRFQDVDEAAHYEWLVRNAGIGVHYCAELFENDGSLTSAIMKSLKRVMAGEYSRELSRKVWAAQVHQFKLGFRMGGPARYGLRRLLVAADGSPKMILEHGSTKNIRDDRVVLVAGPADELAVVRRICRLSTRDDLSDRQIVELLNAERVPASGGRPWSQYQVKQILTGEIYTGCAIFNRTSGKLGSRAANNPEVEWVRRSARFRPIISRRQFRDAQHARKHRVAKIYSDAQLLDLLRRLLKREGRLSLDLIERAPDLPHPASFRRRFGGLHAAFSRIGYYPAHRGPAFGAASLRPRNEAFVTQVAHLLKQSGAHVQRLGPVGLVRVDRSLTLAVTVARFHRNPARRYWKVSLNPDIQADYMFIGLLSEEGGDVLRYYLLPTERFPAGNAVHLSENAPAFDAYRLPAILSLYPALQLRMAETARCDQRPARQSA